METNIQSEKNYIKAKNRVEKIKKFYKHLATYIIINIFLLALFIYGDVKDGATFTESLLQKSNYNVIFFWGIGLVLDAINTFGFNLLLTKDWEERKINEYVNQQKR